MTRLFVGVVPPQHAVDHLDAFLDVRREHGAFRWTLPEHWHLTLAFLGDVHDRHLDELVERLGRAGHKRKPLELRIAGGGAFPNVGRAKVIWAGVEGDCEGLRQLATGVRASCAKAGAPASGEKFTGHLTLARTGHPVEASNWVRLLDAYAGPGWVAEEFALVASYLGEGPRKRPRYEVIESFPLVGGRGAGAGPAG